MQLSGTRNLVKLPPLGRRSQTRPRTVRGQSSTSRLGLSALSLLLLSIWLSAPLYSETSLRENSPFLPPGHGEKKEEEKAPVVQTQGPISREIEFRGLAKINGVYRFSLFNKQKQKSYWLKEQEREDGISVSNYNKDSLTVVVLMNGRSERLSLMSASDSPIPVAKEDFTPTNKIQATSNAANRNQSTASSGKRKIVPRRRVILPNKK